AAANLTIPLADLLGLADRPGEAHGLGPLDPALCRDLAATAARSPHSTWCITITSPEGYAIGHGCARPARRSRGKSPPPGTREWTVTKRHDRPGPPGGWGAWTLTLPDGRQFDVQLGPIPVTDCDHRYESHGYQPSDLLRHLVQIRDGECTFPACSRHARESDFEHALPYDKGGRTCACNHCNRELVKLLVGLAVLSPVIGLMLFLGQLLLPVIRVAPGCCGHGRGPAGGACRPGGRGRALRGVRILPAPGVPT